MSSNSVPRSVRFEAWRLVTVYVVVVLVFVAFLVRLLRLQVIEGANWKTSAVDNYTFEVSVPAPRGIIYDRNG